MLAVLMIPIQALQHFIYGSQVVTGCANRHVETFPSTQVVAIGDSSDTEVPRLAIDRVHAGSTVSLSSPGNVWEQIDSTISDIVNMHNEEQPFTHEKPLVQELGALTSANQLAHFQNFDQQQLADFRLALVEKFGSDVDAEKALNLWFSDAQS